MSNSSMNTKPTTPSLSHAQITMLKAASQRDDRCLAPMSSLRGAQIVKAGEKLIAAGLVREVKAKGSLPIWRRDGATGTAFALKLTAAGAKAIARQGEAPEEAAADKPPACVATPACSAAPLGISATTAQQPAVAPSIDRPARSEPRPTSKIAAVIGLLSRSEGATLAELIAATGWLPHTTRAALTGLRKRGYVLTLDRTDRGSLYCIASKPTDGAALTTESTNEAA